MYSTDSGILILFNLSQPPKAHPDITRTVLGSVTLSRESQLLKPSIVSTPSGNLMFLSLLHSPKANRSILLREEGNCTFSSEVHS